MSDTQPNQGRKTELSLKKHRHGHVFRAKRSPLCSKCRKETRKPDQRWGANCMAEYQRNWRKSRTKRFHELEQQAGRT